MVQLRLAEALPLVPGDRFVIRANLPAQDQSRFLVTIKTPLGTSIEAMDQASRECETYLMSLPEIRQYYLAIGGFGGKMGIGGGPGGGADACGATMTLT